MTRPERDITAAAVLALLVSLPLVPAWLQGLTPFWSDLTYIHHPWRAFDAQALAAGRLPLWDPYIYFGMPGLASMQDALFYPGTLPYFFFGFSAATALFQVFHYWLAGVLTYLWLRALRLTRLASFGGALLFCLGGVFAGHRSFLNHIAVLSLAPAFLLFFRRPLLLGLSLALAFLAGYPPFLAGSALASWVLALIAMPRERRGWLRACVRDWTAGGLVSLGFCACLLLPAAELFAQSRRSSGMGPSEVMQLVFTPRDLWQWVSPVIAGWSHFNPAVEWWKCTYLGFGGFLAAAWGFLRLERARALGLLAALSVLAVLLLGGSNPLSAAIWSHAPGLRFIRYPANLAFMALPALSMLAAVGLQRWPRRGAWLAGLMVLELLAYGWRAFPAAPWSLFTTAGPLARRLQDSLGDDRYLLSPRALEMTVGKDIMDWRFRLYGLTNAPFRLRSSGNFGEPLVPRGSWDLRQALYHAPGAEQAARLFAWADIRFLLTPERLPPSRKLMYEGRTIWNVYRFDEPVSCAYFFDAGSGERIPEGLPASPLAMSGRPLDCRREREDRLEVSGAGSEPGWAYVSEPLYPGWKARLETSHWSLEADARPAMGAFQKIRVPAGPWTLSFRYDPESWRLGRWASLAFLMGFALYCYNLALRTVDEI